MIAVGRATLGIGMGATVMLPFLNNNWIGMRQNRTYQSLLGGSGQMCLHVPDACIPSLACTSMRKLHRWLSTYIFIKVGILRLWRFGNGCVAVWAVVLTVFSGRSVVGHQEKLLNVTLGVEKKKAVDDQKKNPHGDVDSQTRCTNQSMKIEPMCEDYHGSRRCPQPVVVMWIH